MKTQNVLTESESMFREENLKTVLEYFYEFEAKQPNAPFLRQPYGSEWKSMSWAEAGDQARRMAAALRDLGLAPGDKVGIFSKNCYHWIIADLAIMMGGFVSTPFYPNLTADQLREVLALSDAKALFVGKLEEWEQQKPGVPEDLSIIRFPHYPGNSEVSEDLDWDELTGRHEPLSDPAQPGLHDLWTILFTSGTTGSPKGVMHTYFAPAALLYNEQVHNNLKVFEGTEHRYFSYLPLNHIAERVIVELATIMTGGTIYFAESIDTFAQNLQEASPTLFMAVPRIWSKFQLGILERLPQKRLELLLKIPLVSSLIKTKIQKGLGLRDARIMLTGAAPTPDALKEWFQKLGLTLQEVYAMTENCGGCTLMPRDAVRSGTVGKPLPNVELRIDPDSGEVLMKAPWVMTGYYKQPEQTAETLRDGWLHTGDKGELTPEGYLRLTGRVSDTFKSAKGKYIVPAPLEWGFAKNTFIEQICVVGLALPQPIALVVLSELGKRAPREEVRESLARSLAEVNAGRSRFEQLKQLVVVNEPWTVDNGLLTPTMKIRRAVMHEFYQDKYESWIAREEVVVWEG
jgi:long-subunit acyl-CoA synthetase (AMP-forming)